MAVADGGVTPVAHDGYMWDLTVDGIHDFYVAAGTTTLLVHNCEIKGFRKHGLDRALGRDGHGVNERAMLDAVKNPMKLVRQADGAVKYVGKDATVILNKMGEVISTWARNSAGWRF